MGEPRHPSAALRVAVCVATCLRPKELQTLLEALERQELGEPPVSVNVIVVDNDPQGSARATCLEALTWLPFPLHYAQEKRRGIPFARNRALELAVPDSDFVAFVDDDEIPDPDWLAELVRAQRRSDADVVTGPCLPRFLSPPPAWVVEGAFFERPRYADGAERPVAFSHNVLMRSELLRGLDRWLDERLQLNVGEDAEFFARLARAGHRIVWADDAVVHDCVLPGRLRVSWILGRAFRIGSATSQIARLHGASAADCLQRALHGGWCLAKGAATLVPGAVRGQAAAVEALRLAWFGAGLLAGLVGVGYRESLSARRGR